MTDGISTDASFTILNALISRTEMMSSGESMQLSMIVLKIC